MAITVIIDFELKPEFTKEIIESFKTTLKETRAYDGCLGLSVLQDSENPNHIIFYEQWKTKEHQLRYIQWRVESGMMDKMGAVLASLPVTKYFESVQTY